MSSNEVLVINSDGILYNCNESCLWLNSGIPLEETTNRAFDDVVEGLHVIVLVVKDL